VYSFKILFAVAEASPLVKVGGLGDVAGSLPKAIRHAGHDARIVLPRYGTIRLEKHETTWLDEFDMTFMGRQERVGITQALLKDGTPVYLVGNKTYFDRVTIYGDEDDLERFLLFSLAVMEVPRILDWPPDIIHCHDWHTGIVPALLKVAKRNETFYSSCASVFTIHNLAYQGWFDDFFAGRAGLYDYMPPSGDPLREKTYSMMGLGIYHGDVISTVSETYAREILTPEYGMGLEALLRRRRDSLFGIINGIDYAGFNPATDSEIAANYDINTPGRRIGNKIVLQKKAGLPVSTEIPLIGMAGRVVEQKGFDIALEALGSLLAKEDVQFVLQGTGEARYEESLRTLESLYPDKVRMFLTLDFSLAQLIFAGCDIFLVPSRFEPCGLSSLIAMRYGAIPVVRRTGGLAETVADCSSDLSSGLGFTFERYDTADLLVALRRALNAFQKKKNWHQLMIRAMKADFSWKNSVPKYEALYKVARRTDLD